MLSEKIINIMNDKVESELLVNEYKNQLKLFNPVVMANKVLQAYREAGF
jgi:hypothetical protein